MQKQNSTAKRKAQQTRLVALALLVFSPTNPRRERNEEADAELRESIRRHGILQPPVVRPMRTKNEDLEVVVGERRVRAAIALKLLEIMVIVRDDLTHEQVLEIQLVENAQREDLNPCDQGRAYARLMSECGYSARKVAEGVGKSVEHVYEYLKLDNLESAVRKLFLDAEHPLTKSHAIEIARLQPADQLKALKQWSFHYQPSVPDLREWIQREIHRRLDAVAFRKADATLVPEAGACTKCPKRAGAVPGLYPGVKPNTCMDRACYEAKLEAWIDAQPASVPRLSDDWQKKQPKGVFRWQQFAQITGRKERCPSTQRGVMVGGHRRGTVIQVCVDTECRRHHSDKCPPTAAEAAEKQKEREAQEREKKIRRRTVDEILLRVPSALGQRELLIIGTVFLQAGLLDLEQVCHQSDLLMGRQDPPSHDELEEAALEHLRSLEAPELSKVLIGWVLHDWEVAAYWKPDRLLEVAQRYGVDIEQIRREVLPETKKKKTKKTEKAVERDLQTSAKPPAETGSAAATSAAV